jgi:hypothetical protein
MVANTINLDRRFLELPRTGDFPTSQYFEVARSQGKLLRWSDIMLRRCAVILGEAGSGKTTEFKEQVRRCRAANGYAFFVPIEALASDGLPGGLQRPEDVTAFQTWQASASSIALFFLDSLDEAKLRRHKLADALRKFGHGIGANPIGRARLIISCRGSDWDVYTDNTAVLDALPRSFLTSDISGGGKTDTSFVFALAPLDIQQVSALATHVAAVTNPNEFTLAITDARAQTFVERPADVIWVANYWRKHKSLGSLRDLVLADAREKLRDSGRSAQLRSLSDQRAWEGALALAGVATLSGCSSFVASDDPGRQIARVGEVDPTSVLSDWAPPEIAELLRLPLFDESTFGRVRIHEQSVQEFLAAAWLQSLVAKGLPRSQLDILLFPRTPHLSESVLRPCLRSTAAWLALNDAQTRNRLSLTAPEVLLGDGDPAGIPVDERQGILRRYVDRHRGRRKLFDSLGPMSLRRFAFGGLGDTVRELVCDRSLPEEVRCALLTIVAEGCLRECACAALQIARDESEPGAVRADAIAAVASTGDLPSLRAELLSLGPDVDTDSSIVSAILKALFPAWITDSEVGQLIHRSQRKPRNLFNGLQYVIEYELPRRCPANRRLGLVRVFLELLNSSDRGDLAWLHRPLLALLRLALQAISDGSPLPPEVDAVLAHFEELKKHHEYVFVSKEEAPETLLQGRPKMRRELFWKRVRDAEEKKGSRIARYHDVVPWNWVLEFSKEDHEWLAHDSVHAVDDESRVLAFDCLLRTKIASADESSRQELVQRLISESGLLAQHLRGLESVPDLAADKEYQSHLRKMRAIEKKRDQRNEENKKTLEAAIDQIRLGQHAGALQHLYYIAGPGSLRREVDAEKIQKMYGREVADAFFEGLRAFWRQADLPRPHEWRKPDRVPLAAILGYAGLLLDVLEGVSLAGLETKLRKLALRLAVWEANQPPSWFADLAIAEPEEARALLEPLVEKEFDLQDDQLRVLRLDQICRLSLPNARAIFVPFVVRFLQVGDPKRLDVLEAALLCVQGGGPEAIQEILALTPGRCRASCEDPKRFALWGLFGMNNDGKGATDFVISLSTQDPSRASEMVEELLSKMWGWGDAGLDYPVFRLNKDGESLSKLIPLAFQHVPRSTDLHHESTYSPNRRDHAQDIRDRLLAWLAELPPEESLHHLQALADDPRLVELRDYLLYRVKERFAAGKSCEPWTAEEIVHWSRRFAHTPCNPSELFDTVWWTLVDIKNQLEGGDHSNKGLFNPTEHPIPEKPVQIELIRELKRNAHSRYVAVAEEEISGSNYPDIRIHNSEVEGAIAIEVKIAERWSYRELVSAISEQIVGQYLRDPKSIYGILAIASSGPRRGWQHEDGRPIATFAELLEQLDADACRIAMQTTMKEIRVLAIDFH